MATSVEIANLNGIDIYGFQSSQEFLDYINNKKCILIALNAEKINKRDSIIERLSKTHIGYPDGIGAVMALRRKGIHSTRIPGAEFWLDIISKYHRTKSFYFIGSTSKVIEQTITNLKIKFPDIKIKGYRDGFLLDGEENQIIEEFLVETPDVVFVATGSPRQEILMAKLMEEYPALYMGLGGSFDVYTGLKKRAPIIFQKAGLEWLYRLIIEPTRWRRQLTYISFSIKVLFNRL